LFFDSFWNKLSSVELSIDLLHEQFSLGYEVCLSLSCFVLRIVDGLSLCFHDLHLVEFLSETFGWNWACITVTFG
jgi:hypothetical protein